MDSDKKENPNQKVQADTAWQATIKVAKEAGKYLLGAGLGLAAGYIFFKD